MNPAGFKRILLTYLSGYLLFGGLGFVFFPVFTQRLMLSNAIYDEPAVGLAGAMMSLLGGLIGYLVYAQTLIAYKFSIVARTLVVVYIAWAWFVYQNPMFIVLEVIILLGLVPSYYILLTDKYEG